jgi:O-antigen/teichoic acid export membrane protein
LKQAPSSVIEEHNPAKAASKIEQSLVRAIAWAGASLWITQFFSWATTIYVARVLTPSDYGLFAIAAVYMGLVSLVRVGNRNSGHRIA